MRILLVLMASFSINSAIAEDQIFACQETHEIGYLWRNNSWIPKNFTVDGKFFIQIKDGKIQPESISGALGGKYSTCKDTFLGHISCQSGIMTNTMYFDTKTSKGSVARQLGSVMPDNTSKDSVSITLFSCQKMQ